MKRSFANLLRLFATGAFAFSFVVISSQLSVAQDFHARLAALSTEASGSTKAPQSRAQGDRFAQRIRPYWEQCGFAVNCYRPDWMCCNNGSRAWCVPWNHRCMY
jgi:hypothetical protein